MADANYLTLVASTIGIPIWFLIVIAVWEVAWKLTAMWKASQKKSLVWFLVMGIINTLGILPILYIFIFSNMGKRKRKKKN